MSFPRGLGQFYRLVLVNSTGHHDRNRALTDGTGPAAQENLGGLVAAAEGVGARLCLEFLPFGGIADLASAWKMVEPLGPSALVTIDSWHWTKQADGPAPEVLRAIPGDRVAYVQVSDVSPTSQEFMFIEAGFGRLLLGEGIADYETLFGALDETGARPFIAPEVFSQDLVRELGPLGAARAARDATVAVLRR